MIHTFMRSFFSLTALVIMHFFSKAAIQINKGEKENFGFLAKIIIETGLKRNLLAIIFVLYMAMGFILVFKTRNY